MGPKGFFRTAALVGAAAVVIGAFGAHGLKERIEPELLVVYETGVKYHFYHAVALLALAGLRREAWNRWCAAAGWAWLGGVVVFSGSLYLLAVTGLRWLGAITPIGGVALVVGWLLLLPAGRGMDPPEA